MGRKLLDKEYFENLANCTVTEHEISSVNKVWINFECMFAEEGDIVLFFHTFGADGITRMCCEAAGQKRVVDTLRNELREEHDRFLGMSVKYENLISRKVV